MSAVAERAPAATAAPPAARPHRYDRPRFLWVLYALVCAYLFVPIVVVVVFSFNDARNVQIWNGFSLRWYRAFLNDSTIQASLKASLEVALVTMVVATVLGTLLAFGLTRARGVGIGSANILMLAPLITPEIVTGVGLLLLFTNLHVTLSLTTVALAHITFSISYVTVIVRARLAALNREVEEAAMDLGATRLGALRLVTLPALMPAILASALLVFVLSFDDFVTSFFVSGSGTSPLPVQIYAMLRYNLSPEVNAVGTVMIAITLVLAAIAIPLTLWRARGQLDAAAVPAREDA